MLLILSTGEFAVHDFDYIIGIFLNIASFDICILYVIKQ